MKEFLKWVTYGAVFAIPFVLLIVSGSMFFPYITGKNFAFRILVEIAFISWFLLCLIDKVYRPRFSWILASLGGLVTVMFFANIFGEYAPKSFFGNYERMEGWITLAHFFVYFVVLASVINTEKLWTWFLNSSLVAAVIMSLYALGQVADIFSISQGGDWRVDARLGNSTYVGVYMLFHMFIAAWLFICTQNNNLRWLYAILFVLFGFILFQTGTRGSMLGLVGGIGLAFSYLAILAPSGATIKKVALVGIVGLALVFGGIWFARDTEIVQSNPILSRFTQVSLSEGGIRFMVWEMAIEGVKERPILGWGQENFNYVFNKYYNPSLYAAEPWYDRTHNILLDWLIAGGVLGLIAYLAVLASALWYGVVRAGLSSSSQSERSTLLLLADIVINIITDFFSTLFWRPDHSGQKLDKHYGQVGLSADFTVSEQALILGLLAAYTFHNLFVFDNLASWILFAIVLAIIHSRVGKEWDLMNFPILNGGVWGKIISPVVMVMGIVFIYMINTPGIFAAQDIISSYREPTIAGKLDSFEKAFSRNGFADQELNEQLVNVAAQIIANEKVSDEEKEVVKKFVEEKFSALLEDKPGDARLHIVLANYYRSINDLDSAMEQLNLAEELSPTKQSILQEKGTIYLMANMKEEALNYFGKAFILDESNNSARVRFAAASLFFEEEDAYRELLDEKELAKKGDLWVEFVNDPFLIRIANQTKRYDLMEEIFQGQIELDPMDSDSRVNLAASYYEMGEIDRAIEVIRQAIIDIPAFKEEGEKIIKGVAGQGN